MTVGWLVATGVAVLLFLGLAATMIATGGDGVIVIGFLLAAVLMGVLVVAVRRWLGPP